eukprot:CAMPEP_0202347190 /NCGR_PEP_ID=MMETSP1126-20121109/5660_1 /ASSEMBLY_ACC=CAM_ASM_000457 /TAXON_ID=3047 /ORGANISM="Dunaliella tertiolecta, Strain CCMP1320" /LENGTH=91 /DNA_ID=CAMNT_0048938709 /DNA_START=749 /DNA_END=1021 /DNA_ORIENTATION=+
MAAGAAARHAGSRAAGGQLLLRVYLCACRLREEPGPHTATRLHRQASRGHPAHITGPLQLLPLLDTAAAATATAGAKHALGDACSTRVQHL